MKNLVILIAVILLALISQSVSAHHIYVKKNPTNESGMEFGVDNATGFVRWRAYVRGIDNNSQSANTGWSNSGNGWWYYDLTSVSQRVMWRLDGLVNQAFEITYWVFKADGTWEYGSHQIVISDQILPTAWYTTIYNNQTIASQQQTIHATSNDNIGVVALRMYVVVPQGCAMSSSGWQFSGIDNQYYLEVNNSDIHYEFIAPCSGDYLFTLWVKDISGNIAYEPDGQTRVHFNFDSDPPAVLPPAAPTNLQLEQSDDRIRVFWQDNASDEQGYLIYRDWQYVSTQPANSNTYQDFAVSSGQEYCYRVYAFRNNLNSPAAEGCITFQAPVNEDYHYASSFSYPLDCDYIYRTEADNNIPQGACFDYQPYGSLFSYTNKIHLGADLNLKGVYDLGEPLYAIANALVWAKGWTSGWGNYLILKINAAPGEYFMTPAGEQVTEIFVLYAHLDEIKIIQDNGQQINSSQIVVKQTYVKQGWQIGTVGDGNGNYSPHLHFEIRIGGFDQLGPGYWAVDDLSYLQYFVDPLEFLDLNANLAQRQLAIYIHGYDRNPSQSCYLDVNSSSWTRQGRVSDGTPLAAVGWSNHFWTLSASANNQATWHFSVPANGSWQVYAEIPRYYATANNVQYKIYHGSQSVANPYSLNISQAYNAANRQINLGQFDFTKNVNYKIVLSGYPASSGVMAADAIILVYLGDYSSGGGTNPPADDQPLTITTDGQISFSYSGSYQLAELHCYGAGLDWWQPIFNNGQTTATVSVSYSDTVYCNMGFEDGNWLVDWLGFMPNEHLSVNGQAISYWVDNGQGGGNAAFNLVINTAGNEDPGGTDPGGTDPGDIDPGGNDPGDTDPGDTDPGDTNSDWHGDMDVHVSSDGAITGCVIGHGRVSNGYLLFNLLLLILPVVAFKLTRLIAK